MERFMNNEKAKAGDQNDVRELEFLESLGQRLPDDPDLWKALADLYTRVGRYEDGLKLDEKLSLRCPQDPMVWYNLGCSLALLKRSNDAFRALERAIELGYQDYDWMKRDADLRSLRTDQRFGSLLKQLKR